MRLCSLLSCEHQGRKVPLPPRPCSFPAAPSLGRSRGKMKNLWSFPPPPQPGRGREDHSAALPGLGEGWRPPGGAEVRLEGAEWMVGIGLIVGQGTGRCGVKTPDHLPQYSTCHPCAGCEQGSRPSIDGLMNHNRVFGPAADPMGVSGNRCSHDTSQIWRFQLGCQENGLSGCISVAPTPD